MEHARGFIALMSVVVIGAILLVYVVSLGVSTFFARMDALTLENKEVSRALAEGCVNAALVRLAGDSGYAPPAGGACVELGGTCGGADPQKVCKICSVSGGTIRARARYHGSYTNVEVVYSSSFGINQWTERSTVSWAGTCSVP
jgi:hypothetical protein